MCSEPDSFIEVNELSETLWKTLSLTTFGCFQQWFENNFPEDAIAQQHDCILSPFAVPDADHFASELNEALDDMSRGCDVRLCLSPKEVSPSFRFPLKMNIRSYRRLQWMFLCHLKLPDCAKRHF